MSDLRRAATRFKWTVRVAALALALLGTSRGPGENRKENLLAARSTVRDMGAGIRVIAMEHDALSGSYHDRDPLSAPIRSSSRLTDTNTDQREEFDANTKNDDAHGETPSESQVGSPMLHPTGS